jgi:uncharacterized protein YjbI with pentapeptide repeats/5-methylcytosine-specific restriction endonuclease McrA
MITFPDTKKDHYIMNLNPDDPVNESEIKPKAEFSHADLSETDLCGANLREAKFENADLSRVHLSGPYVEETNWALQMSAPFYSEADLREAKFNFANLIDATLTYADLTKAKLRYAVLTDADLTNADLTHADLSRATLRIADFSDADLSNADLSNADLWKADLTGATLSKATLRGADLSGTDLSDTDLRSADLRDANLHGTNLSRASLYGADVEEAQLVDAQFEYRIPNDEDISPHNIIPEASIPGADLSKANLRGADLSGADLTDASLEEVNFSGADFTQAELSEELVVETTGHELFAIGYLSEESYPTQTLTDSPPQKESSYPENWKVLAKQAYDRDNYECQNCGAERGTDGTEELYVHHIVPLSVGGDNNLSNLATLCEMCYRAAPDDELRQLSDNEYLYPEDWSVLRKQAYARNNYECQNCGAKGGRDGTEQVHAYHIVPLSVDGNNNLSNLATLCDTCHGLIHPHMSNE